MIDRYLIRYFLSVVDHGNFSRAAAHCGVSQPTLSVGIAKLEGAVARRLFTRSNQRVELTEAGTRFLTHARRIEREFNGALAALAETPQGRSFRLGILHSVPGRIAAAAARDCADAADVGAADMGAVEIVFAGEREIAAQLARNRLDAALTILRDAAQPFARRPVLEEGYGVVIAADHRLADRERLAPEDLAGETMIVRRHCELLSETSRYFVERGVRPHFALRTTNDERAVQMVAAGLGITVMPDSYRGEGIRHIPLAGFGHRRRLGLLFVDEAQAAHPLAVALEARLRGMTGGG